MHELAMGLGLGLIVKDELCIMNSAHVWYTRSTTNLFTVSLLKHLAEHASL